MIAAVMSGRLRINAGSAAVPKACHYLCDVSSNHVALQMFPLPQQSYSDDRLMEVVGRRNGSLGQGGIRKLGESWVTIKTS